MLRVLAEVIRTGIKKAMAISVFLFPPAKKEWLHTFPLAAIISYPILFVLLSVPLLSQKVCRAQQHSNLTFFIQAEKGTDSFLKS